MGRVVAQVATRLSVAMTASLLVVSTVPAQQPDRPLTLEQLRQMRRELAHAPRGIIANNDGCDCLYFPGDREVTVQGFLDLRTTALADSQVGTIAYCTISSGFSFFTHDTKVGTPLTRQPGDYGLLPTTRNISQDLIHLGSDCLKSVVDFAHAHGMEAFWSMRMNDTHDAAWRPDQPYLLYPPLKEEHPEWLVSDPVRGTTVGRWSSVNYALPEVRDLAFGYIEEVCRNYDVDGIELDFFRHMCYFTSVAHGGVASPEECEMMTDLIRRVRAMTEEVGLQRGRPILVAVRVADSVPFNRDVGLDIERWLEEGLVDLLITTCYFRLNPWQYSVELGHRYGVPVYPCLSDSRVQGETRFRRQSVEGFRGRAMNAWSAGADGIHLFNYFNPRGAVFREVGDAKALAGLDKLYFATVRDGSANAWLVGGEGYRTVPVLTPQHPVSIAADAPVAIELQVGEDLAAARAAGAEPTVTLHLELPGLARAEQVRVTLNGHELSDATLAGGWVDLPLHTQWLVRGANRVEVALVAEELPAADEWTIVWEGGELPKAPWYRDPGSERTAERLEEGTLLIADRGTVPGDYHYYRYAWGATPEEPVVIEARARVVSGSSYVIFGNGAAQDRLGLFPDHIELWSDTTRRWDVDTTDDFHTYRIETEGEDLRVYVDGALRIDAPRHYAGRPGFRQLAFGAANSTQVGEAWWEFVRARLTSRSCRDLVLSVDYP
ncbi:MAG: family 10 glycosylhydrolase [Armatimonadota bacterium]